MFVPLRLNTISLKESALWQYNVDSQTYLGLYVGCLIFMHAVWYLYTLSDMYVRCLIYMYAVWYLCLIWTKFGINQQIVIYKFQVPHFMEICPMGATLIHADRQTVITEDHRCFFVTMRTRLILVQFNSLFFIWVLCDFVTLWLSNLVANYKGTINKWVQKQ
jgi:hypothetical protein